MVEAAEVAQPEKLVKSRLFTRKAANLLQFANMAGNFLGDWGDHA